MNLRIALLLPLCAGQMLAQWTDLKTAGVPRTKNGELDLTAPTTRTADRKPDLSGLWRRDAAPNPAQRRGPLDNVMESVTSRMPKDAVLPMLPDAEALYQKRFENYGVDRPSGYCLPHAIPDAMAHGGPMRVVQNPGLTILLFEEFTHFRQIFSDGRKIPKDPNPTWFGYSVGKWEGDTFVVESAGFNGRSWLDDIGHPVTDRMRTIERFRRPDFGHLEVEITIDDPGAYSRPWSLTHRFTALVDDDMIEDICENERDRSHMVGK